MLVSNTNIEVEQLLKYSPLESDRFGFRVFRGNLNEVNQDEISDFLQKEMVDIAIFRVPSEVYYQISRCLDIGFPFITADTLVYYKYNLIRSQPKSLKNNLTFIECTQDHLHLMDELVSDIFVDYTNHYYSNPVFDKNDLLEGYKEWAQSYIGNKQKGKISWLVKKGENIVGFAACSFENDECEGVLYGVLKKFSGNGIYGDMIRFTQNYFKENGYINMLVSTQIQNYAVQKVWTREGFMLDKSFNTVHINSFINKNNID